MRVFISGVDGNMGNRYRVVLNELGFSTLWGADNEISFLEQAEICKNADIDRIVIATPTATHMDAIHIFSHICPHTPLLCEKPISKNLAGYNAHINLTMVNQYEYLVDKDGVGPTYYDYFKTGSDGLLWDCINIIGMANGEVTVNDSSYSWQCMINGKKLSITDMDKAYLKMVDSWLKNPVPNIDYIEHAHKAVWKYMKIHPDQKNMKPEDTVGEEAPVIQLKPGLT